LQLNKNITYLVQNISEIMKKINYKKLFFIGCLSILSSPPINFFPILFFIIPYFFTAVNNAKSSKDVAKITFVFGFGYYLGLVHWISISMLSDIKYAILLPVSLTVNQAYFSGFLVFTMYIYSKIKPKIQHELMQILCFAIMWIIHEKLRSGLFFKFPWWTIGMSVSSILEWVQPLSIIGVGIFGFSILLLYLSPIVALSKVPKFDKVFALFLIFAANVSFLTYGHFRLKNPSEVDDLSFNIIAVQTNFTQYQKREDAVRSMDVHYNLTKSAIESVKNNKPNLVVWAETSVPYAIDSKDDFKNDDYFKEIRELLGKNDIMIFGGTSISGDDYMNSAFMIDKSGLKKKYDKVNLVPFGEYTPIIPFKLDYLPSMKAGKDRQSWQLFDKTFVPLICYEVLFDGNVKKMHPDFIVNISNDGWFGKSIGPHQHMMHARISAIKNHANVIRVANTGSSALIDKYGRIVGDVPRYKEGFGIITI
jgi:apolipoprotein N-acyltransferase